MTQLAPARAALQSGDRERAKSLLVQSFDQAPGESALLLAQIALEEGEHDRAAALARTAMENYVPEAAITLADAVGRQGRRAEAEQIALDALSANADSGLLRAVLGEQRVRQAKWDLGTQDFVDALSLNDRDEVVRHLWRVTRDLTIGHRAERVPTDRAMAFVDRIESGTSRVGAALEQMFAHARRSLGDGTVMPEMPQRVVAAPAPPPPQARPPQPPPAPTQSRANLEVRGAGARLDHSAPPQPDRASPDLVAVMGRDRQLNERLQSGLEGLGLPVWPSDHKVPLDVIPAMVPKNLAIDREEFTREHLNVTSGSVASEIVVERALQSLLQALTDSTATSPEFDEVGLTKVELALWDGVLDRMRPIPQIYLAHTQKIDARVLAIGAFLGACVVKPGEATWTFGAAPADSTIETVHGDLEPFDYAQRWVVAADKDDVNLEGFLDEAYLLAGLTSTFLARHDTTEGLKGAALEMKLAELWTSFCGHPRDTAQNTVAGSIRPLNVLDELIFFALGAQYAPRIGTSPHRDEVAVAYVRATGEFLLLTSRKHFARAVGILIGRLTPRITATVLDLFGSFHAPGAKVFQDPQRKPKLETRSGATMLRFGAEIGGQPREFALVHTPDSAVEWQLLEV